MNVAPIRFRFERKIDLFLKTNLLPFTRELREEYHQLANRENDTLAKRKELEHKFDGSQSEILSLKNDLRLALQRISDLQQAMEEGDDDSSER